MWIHLHFTFENLTNKIVEKSPSRDKATMKRLRKDKQSDGGKASSEPLSDSGEIDQQIKQRKKKQKIKINSSRAKAGERKECHKGSSGDKSEHEYDDNVSSYADDDSGLTSNLNNNLGIYMESDDEEPDSGLKGLIQELDKDEEIRGKINKDLAGITNKVGKNLMLLKNSKQK